MRYKNAPQEFICLTFKKTTHMCHKHIIWSKRHNMTFLEPPSLNCAKYFNRNRPMCEPVVYTYTDSNFCLNQFYSEHMLVPMWLDPTDLFKPLNFFWTFLTYSRVNYKFYLWNFVVMSWNFKTTQFTIIKLQRYICIS